MRRLALFAALLAALVLSASVPAFASGMDSPPWVPAADERAFVVPGNAESDALLDCYGSPERDDSDPDAPHLGPPRITVSPVFGLILRADYAPRKWSDPGVHRMMCWRHGSMAEMHLVVPPLYPSGTLKADAATESAIAGWRARKDAAKAAAMTARRFAPPDAATKQLLEGIWLLDAKPKGTCLSHAYGYETQIEFEFRKSGGRALIFEPPDLFSAVQISGIERSGDVLVVQARARDGGLHEFMHIRPMAADRIELLPLKGSKSQIAYKCGEPDVPVTSDVSLERLSTIAPPITGSMTLLAQIPGVSDDDLCNGRNIPRDALSKRRSLQFELYGPVHHWLFGWQFWPEHKFVFDFVRSVEDRGDKGLLLHMQEHLDKGPGWDVEAGRGKTYDLTVLPHGDHIEIPELATIFVRCKPADPVGAGMARW